MRTSLICLAFVARLAYGQSTSQALDENTGISFERYYDTTGFSFGVVAPDGGGADFIGQLVMPATNSSGYCGVSLTGMMVGSILITAWPYEQSVMSSLRETSGYTNPLTYTNSSVSLAPIANGTFVNSTHMSYTFVCSGCLNSAYSFASSIEVATIGWALGSGDVTNAASSDSAVFTYHSAGFGDFGMNFSNAKSANYSNYASMASLSNTTSSSNLTTTCIASNSNISATVSNITYDYIVAGAGPAGIIAAQRMAESGKSVLLLERGAASTYVQGGRSLVSWNDTVTQYDVPSMAYYLTTASDTSEYCTDVASMAGCILGGGTMVNALMFVRPQDKDFDDKWPTGWKWTDVNASANALYERNPGTTLASEDGKRYDQGAYNVLAPFFQSLGYTHVNAIESPNLKTKVFSYPPWDIQDGLRAGPVKSYLPLAQAMSNFKLTLNTKVVRAIRNGSAISGVEVEDSTGARQIINLNAGGNVILASGTMSTPRILFNSGIGPSDQINIVKNGCSSVTLPAESDWINLPVGKNLRDHPIFTLTFNTTATVSNTTTMLAAAFTSPNATDIDLFATASGPLAQSGQRMNFWTSLNTTNGTRYFQGTCNSPAKGQVRIKLYLTHGATSSGALSITSSGATEFSTQPLMNTDDDKSVMVTMIDSLLEAARNSTILVPADGTVTGASLVAADSYTSGDHFVGTAIMGATNDGSAVVDTDTKVYGTDNLFVVDGSIHPDLPTGNTQAIIMVAAEHAAGKIIALGSSSTSAGNVTTESTTTGNSPLVGSIAAPIPLYPNITSTIAGPQQTTLTVKATLTQTITSCAASVTNCPSRPNKQTEIITFTETVDLTTTVCPVSDVASARSAIIASFSATDITAIASSQFFSRASVSATASLSSASTTGSAYARFTTVSSNVAQVGSLVPNVTPVPAGPQSILTVDVTQIYTITACAASVTNCPARSASASTVSSAFQVVTTVAVSDIQSASSAIMSSAQSNSPVQASEVLYGHQATLTVDITQIYTITSCAASITNCPARSRSNSVVSSVFQVTTVVPVSEAASVSSALVASSTYLGASSTLSAIISDSENSPVMSSSSSNSASITSDVAPYTNTALVPGPSIPVSSPGLVAPFGNTTYGDITNAIVSSSETAVLSGPRSTLTVDVTEVLTITSCAASVTNCPASKSRGIVVTKTHQVTTVVAPSDAQSISSAILASGTNYIAVVTATSSDNSPLQTTNYAPSGSQQSTLVVDVTQVQTVTSCAASITDCPARASESTSQMVVTQTHRITTVVAASDIQSASSAILASGTNIAAFVPSVSESDNSPVQVTSYAASARSTSAGPTTTLTIPITQLISSTISATTSGTVTQQASVIIVTQTIDLLTTICPVAEATSAASAVQSSYTASATNIVSIVVPSASASAPVSVSRITSVDASVATALATLDTLSSAVSAANTTTSSLETTSSSTTTDSTSSSSGTSLSELIEWLKTWISTHMGGSTTTGSTTTTTTVKRGRYARAMLDT